MFADCQLMGMDLAFPDICKTPPALLPIPYPNFALGPMGIPNVWNVLLMAMPAHNLLTTIALSNGDNPGIGMGLISQTVMAQARRITCVPNVLFGCIPATRLTGLTVQNTINTVGMRVVPSQLKVVLLGGGGGGGGAARAATPRGRCHPAPTPRRTIAQGPGSWNAWSSPFCWCLSDAAAAARPARSRVSLACGSDGRRARRHAPACDAPAPG
ncbi:PF13665 domain protein, partial [Bordetella bronchiseptica B18-5 (C3)]|uniref:DUF4150 domain-containing protein n=1 Tax=Bordetella bronchiseptica TaxID=518 RepID=UPI00049F9E76